MIGRDEARHQLEGAAAAARGGDPALVLISGEAGIGKTRLVSDATSRLDAECVLVTGAGVDVAGGELPWVLLSSSARSLVQQYGLDALRSWAGHDAGRLAVLVRELEVTPPELYEPLAVVDAFREMLARISTTRFVWWAVDDLQWADPMSMDALRFVVQLMLPPERLLVTCTLRTQHWPSAGIVGSLVSELARAPSVQRIRLDRLDPDQVRAQIASLRGEEVSSAFAERVRFLSDGVPFLVEELVAAGLAESGPLPASATELMLSRLVALGAHPERVVRAGSVAQERLHDRWLGPVTGLSPTDLEEAVTRLVEGGVLELDDTFEGYRFHHALMREGVSGAMLPAERRRWHLRWAEALSSVDAEEHDVATLVEITQHWIRSGVPDRGFVSALAAAGAAERVGAQAERAVMLCEALRLWSRISSNLRAGHAQDDLVERAIWACSLGGKAELGLEMLDAQLAEPATGADADLRRLRLSLARDWFARASGSPGEPSRPHVLEQDVAVLRESPRSLLFAHAVADLAATSVDVGTSTALDDLVRDALEVTMEMGTSFDRVDVQDARSHHLKVLGRLDEAANLLLEILRDHGDELQLSDLMRVESNAVSHLYSCGRFTEGAAIGRRSISRLPDPRLCPAPWTSLAENVAVTLIETGEWADASRYLDRIEALGADSPSVSVALLDRVQLLCRRGDLDAAEDLLATADPPGNARSTPPDFDLCRLLVAAEVDLAKGDSRAAWAVLAPVWHGDDGRDLVIKRDALLMAARALAAALQPNAPTWAEPLEEHARDLRQAAARLPAGVWPQPWRERFEIELARCSGHDTQDHWDRCVTESERLGQPYEQGLALLGMARRAMADRATPVARDALEQADAIARRLGSQALAGAIREAASRGRIPLDTASPPAAAATAHGLTVRELEVLRLVADGYRNDEIAETLFISPKTVSAHVSRILGKLGVTSRGAASALAHREGLLTDASG
jgi:DNA-binding CsgD family transcriptional regulator